MLDLLARYVRERWHPLWRLRRIRGFRALQNRFDRTVFWRIPETGIRVAIKLIRDASWIANSDGVEPEIRRAFEMVLAALRPSTFWDVGANIGFYSWVVRRYPSVKQVVLFEPDPTNFGLIQKTITENLITDCEAMNVAVSNECGRASFLLDHASGTTGSLSASAQAQNAHSLQNAYGLVQTISCEVVTIDSLLERGFMPPELVKIDVEGAEHLVLRGADACLRSAAPTIIVETSNADFLEGVGELGYRIFRIDPENLLCVPRRHWGRLDDFLSFPEITP